MLEKVKGGMGSMLLENLTLVDREGRVPLLMRQHAVETGLEVVELARGKNIGTLVIDSDTGDLIYTVDMSYES